MSRLSFAGAEYAMMGIPADRDRWLATGWAKARRACTLAVPGGLTHLLPPPCFSAHVGAVHGPGLLSN